MHHAAVTVLLKLSSIISVVAGMIAEVLLVPFFVYNDVQHVEKG